MNDARALALQSALMATLVKFIDAEAGEGLTYPEMLKAIEDLRAPLIERFIACYPEFYFKPRKRGET